MHKHKMTVARTAHYYTLGVPGLHVRHFWIVCHGYGQLARNFLRKFDGIKAGDTLVLAPEGLSRFYWEGLGGKAAASWMTREDRLDEIADYTRYLQTLYDQYLPQLSPDVRIHLLGFSQGCATQMRWIMRFFPGFHTLVLWAGLIPEDLDYLPHLDYFSDKSIHFVYGHRDPYLTPERTAMHEELIRRNGLRITAHTYDGHHSVDRGVLEDLALQIRQGK